ncbi:hypothetical protein RUM43_002362 [Polyplax serrata]|uniref:Uncharacterized protein n=1 Tax=Polyplax serrata TaxID=468196 RepID=A0AAN8PDS2_POLSC
MSSSDRSERKILLKMWRERERDFFVNLGNAKDDLWTSTSTFRQGGGLTSCSAMSAGHLRPWDDPMYFMYIGCSSGGASVCFPRSQFSKSRFAVRETQDPKVTKLGLFRDEG